ncbi:MAG: DUF2207 domain-containing protein [Devosiaceae bacterium]|nr:DUF2207 domain-containing protein [Devosiaceae bacterium]
MDFQKTAVKFVRFVLLSLFSLMAGVFPVAGEEVIRSYSSNIVLLENGTVDVTETIRVNAEGKQIKRGIFRDIPTTLTSDDGSIIRSDLTIISIERDGKPEPYFTSSIDGGTRIYVGESSVFLPYQTFTYTIRYTMTRMARYFPAHDELYWNATGNFWNFPIEQAVAQITLPEGAKIIELNAYTGQQGSTQSDAKFSRSSDNTAIFRANRSFLPREGLSVSVLFEKGVMAEPGGIEKLYYYLSDHRKTIFPLLAVFLVMLYYVFSWNAVGRDPEKGTIIPLFTPPEGFSPALSHFIHHMGWKKSGWTAYSAALVSLATRGLVNIERDNKKKIIFTHLKQADMTLPRGEAVIEEYLTKKKTLKITKSTGKSIAANKQKFIKAIISENQNAYFFNNFVYTGIGVAISLLAIFALSATGVLLPEHGILVLSGGIGAVVLVIAVFAVMGASTVGKIVVFAWFGIVAINMTGGIISLFMPVSLDMPLISSISIIVINIVFMYLMRAPTVHGRKIMDQIDGFKMYLETAEKNRLNFNGEPDFSIERFEKILPYAIALGVEKPWAQRLEGEFARHAIKEVQGGYRPNWYTGSNFNSNDLSQSVAGIASSMSSAMVSAQPSSSSSSGGGGGGFSGGGGGGGGGGGW